MRSPTPSHLPSGRRPRRTASTSTRLGGLLALALAVPLAIPFAGCHRTPTPPTTDSSLPSDTAPTSAGNASDGSGDDGDTARPADAGASNAGPGVPAGGTAASSPR